VLKKFYFKQWTIGLIRGDIKDIIRTTTFDQNINWIQLDSFDHFYADPFSVETTDGTLKILFENFSFKDNYGNISLMTLDNSFNKIDQKIILDTKSNLSYPFIYKEHNKTFVFPEARSSRKLSCYEYNPENESLNFIRDVLNLPLLDATFIKHGDKYWIFGVLTEYYTTYELHVFSSDNLLGPYVAHKDNPIRCGLNGIRSAGNFIEVEGVIYRPTQNCEKIYGESITINKVSELNETKVLEVPYMTIKINLNKKINYGPRSIHTINGMDNLIVIDGEQWTFAPVEQFKKFTKDMLRRINS
jgi:hypothetical protein